MEKNKRQIWHGKRSVKTILLVALLVVVLGILFVVLARYKAVQGQKQYSTATFAMDTMVNQSAYGANAQKAMEAVNVELAAYQDRLSLFVPTSDIVRINKAAGKGGADVSKETVALLAQAQQLSAQSEGAFAVTIAPLVLAWGVTTETPRVVPQTEIDTLLPLVDDTKIQIEGNHVLLPETGMGIDLGGIAKGASCSVVKAIYEEYGVESALLSIGGNIYAHGTKPDGTPYRIGFRDPEHGENSYIASFAMQDEVIAVSGGYERFFEQDGNKYIHIIDPRTGKPAVSDIASVGAIRKDGAEADFYSTTLFVWGKERTLQYMQDGGKAIMLDSEKNLYVSSALRDSFELKKELEGQYTVVFIGEKTA